VVRDLSKGCKLAARPWGAAPPWDRHTLPPGMGGLPHRSPARLVAVHWLFGSWASMGSFLAPPYPAFGPEGFRFSGA
jgi:hypothetical protein